MKYHFDHLALKPALFYAADYGIRFEIALPGTAHKDPRNLRQIEERTTAIFNHVFQDSDELLVITDVHCEKKDTFLQKRATNVFKKYMKSKRILTKLQHAALPSLIWDKEDEEYEDMVTHRFVLPCQKRDVRYRQLLVALSYKDFSHPTQILKHNCHAGYNIYFINVTKKIIYHLYDDRGCDVVATSANDLRTLYEECNDWILDYDRAQIDRIYI